MFDFASLGLNKVETIVDVGAGYGAFLGPALAFYKPSRWLAIEMLPERCVYLREKFGAGNVRQVGVGAEHLANLPIKRTVSADSSSFLPINPQSQTWFSVGPHGMDQYVDGEILVWTLDEIMSFAQIQTVGLMKIDIQGYEGRAIIGGQATLKKTRALIIEVLYCHHYYGQATPEEIDWRLRELGFEKKLMLTDDWNFDKTVHLQGDAFYVNTTAHI